MKHKPTLDMSIEYTRADPAMLHENVPTDMRVLPVWLNWKQEADAGGEKPKKIPYYADGKKRNGTLDSPSDRNRLVTFDEAMSVYQADREYYMGPGVALGPVPDTSIILSGIDPDNSVREGQIAPPTQRVIDATGSYAEVSPSHTGVKIFGTGDIGREVTPDLEIYSRGRFFTVTGEKIQGDHLADLTEGATLARELLLKSRTNHRSALAGDIVQGSRNHSLYRIACALRGRDVPKDTAWQALQDRNGRCVPPLDLRELKQLFDSAWKRKPGFPLTDLGNAERLVAHHEAGIRYLTGGGWYTFEGHRYVADRARKIVVLMGETARNILAEAAATSDPDRRKKLAAWAMQSESRTRIDNAITLAAPQVAEPLEQYDDNPFLIGLQNGVYDLERDKFRAGRPDDRITCAMNVSFDAKAICPKWERFQLDIHKNDATLVAFKQRALGHSISGDVSEQKLYMGFGEGSNGKTTEQNVMLELAGDYGRKIAPETLMVRKSGAATNDIARLRGARFVATVEVEDGRQLAESLTKQLTGKDKMTARFLYQENIEFKPTWKIWLATNHKPEITGTDFAIWRRIVLIPYEARFTGVNCDPRIEEKLLGERPGIFNWLVEGYRQWTALGLAPPDVVTGATADYKTDMDRIGNFLRECCKHGPSVKGSTAASKVYLVYANWTKAGGQFPLSAKKFHERMKSDHHVERVNLDVSTYKNLLLVTHAYDGEKRGHGASGSDTELGGM